MEMVTQTCHGEKKVHFKDDNMYQRFSFTLMILDL